MCNHVTGGVQRGSSSGQAAGLDPMLWSHGGAGEVCTVGSATSLPVGAAGRCGALKGAFCVSWRAVRGPRRYLDSTASGARRRIAR